MRITIAERLRPFTHRPGSYCILPGTTIRLQIFPALVRIHDLSKGAPVFVKEYAFNIQGPVKDFALEQDLEKGCIRVWGHTQKGFMRYTCHAGLEFRIEKNPEGVLDFGPKNSTHYRAQKGERLSLGCHKAQDWEMIHRRLSMAEIFPHWFRLGQLTPLASSKILHEVTIPEQVVPEFEKLFMAGFDALLSPRLEDGDHQGLQLPKMDSALQLLTEGATLIRNLFVKQEENTMQLLPCLPPEFHCGRFIGIVWPGIGTVDMEWSKKTLRRVILHSEREGEVYISVPKHLKSFRIRQGNRDRGHRISRDQSLLIRSHADYYLDNFQH